MGIINATPDSFYAASRIENLEKAVEMGRKMVMQGADILDIGGESTRPGADPVPEEEELERVIPLISCLKHLNIPLSIDTIKPKVAARAIENGVTLINDVSGFSSSEMCEVAASTRAHLCIVHMQGTPQNMQHSPEYSEGVVHALLKWFEKKLNSLKNVGIDEKNIIIDPGIGFGKTVQHNIEIIQNLHKFKCFGLPVLLGVSRKSFMTKILNKPASELLSTTLAVNTMAILAEVDIIRVHDVQEHRDIIDLLSIIRPNNTDVPKPQG